MAQEARQALEAATELSKLLDCGLDKEALSICIALLEQGVNPEVMASMVWGALWARPRSRSRSRAAPDAPSQALAEVVTRLRKQAAEGAQQQQAGSGGGGSGGGTERQ